MNKVHTFSLDLNWTIINDLTQLDRFDASWASTETREGLSLKQLRYMATVQSVGASTRIEGSKMSDEEVDILLSNLSLEKLSDRDTQEVAGYYEVFEIISESYDSIEISESEIKGLHNRMLKFSETDRWHKGDFKKHSNNVEATMPDGSKQIIFETTPPGFETEDMMSSLVAWYAKDRDTHPLIKSAVFSYEFVSIHPFQDGNGRLSRLLSTLLLLKSGYKWIQYVSLEHEIENRKAEYYRELRKCQAQRPNENITSWVVFFLDALINIQEKLDLKLKQSGIESKLSPREKAIITLISNNPGCKSGFIADRLDIPNPTVKRIVKALVDKSLIQRHGAGPGTNYTIN